jgi:hypothetical protein
MVLYASHSHNVSARGAPASYPAFCGIPRKYDVTFYGFYVAGQTDGFYVTFRTANDLRKKFLKLRDKVMNHPIGDSKKNVQLRKCLSLILLFLRTGKRQPPISVAEHLMSAETGVLK